MTQELILDVHPDRLAIRLNRSSRRNSLTQNLIQSLLDIVIQNKNLPLILRAAAPAFCAGFDLDWIAEASQSEGEFQNALHLLYQLYRALLNHNAPTLALVEGPAIGGGAGLAFCFDSILISPAARFALPQGELKPLADIVLPVANRKIPHWKGEILSADQALFQHIADGPIVSLPIGSFIKTPKRRAPLDEIQVEHFFQIAMNHRESVHAFLMQSRK